MRLLYTKLEGDGPERGAEPLPRDLHVGWDGMHVTYVTAGWVSFNSAKGAVLIREVDEAEQKLVVFEDACTTLLIQSITRLKHLVVQFMWISLLRSHFFCLLGLLLRTRIQRSCFKKLRIQSQEHGVSKLTILRKQVQRRSIAYCIYRVYCTYHIYRYIPIST